MRRLIVLVSLLAGCTTDRLDITNCDPRQQTDCYSVSEEFLLDHFDMKDDYKATKKALKDCHKRL